jgi:predicted dehydrogenase
VIIQKGRPNQEPLSGRHNFSPRTVLIMADELSVALIGGGYWGPNILRNLLQDRRVTVRYVCDTSGAALDRLRLMVSNACMLTKDPGRIFSDPRVQAVVVATPASTHYSLALGALEAGKQVFVEKPLALRVDEAEQLCGTAEERGLKLMVGHTFLFNNRLLKIRELMDQGRLGKLHYITSTRTHMGLVRSDVNVVWDLAPHDVSILNFLVGQEPEWVSAVASRPLGVTQADVAFIHLSYPSGVLCHMHVSWVDSHKVRQVSVIGSEARLIFDDLNDLEPVRVFEKGIGSHQQVAPEFGQFRLILRDGDIVSPKIIDKEPLAQMMEAFVRLVLEDKPNLSDGRLGLRVTKVLAAAQDSIAANGAPRAVR